MTIKHILRIGAAAVLATAVLLLASCSGLGANTGSVTLTVYNGNTASSGTFDYKNVYVNNKTLVSLDIAAGQSATVKINPGTYYMTYTFDYAPSGGASGSTAHNSGSGTDTFTIPTGSTIYTWNGPVWPNT